MSTKIFASTFRSNIEIEYFFRHSKCNVDNMFSILKHRDLKFVIKTCFANALLQWKIFFFWTKILKILNEFLNKNYANAIIICVWCFLKKKILSFILRILKIFDIDFFDFFEILRTKRNHINFYLLYWYCFYALKINALKKKTIIIRSRYRNVNLWIRVYVTHIWH